MTGIVQTPAWARDPDVIERIFIAALRAGDADGVEAAIRLMLAIDARRGVKLYEALKLSLRTVDLIRAVAGTADPAAIQRLLS